MSNRLLIGMVLLIAAFSCEQNYVPKPHGFPHIELPDHKYKPLEMELPYSFEYPVYCRVDKNNYPNAGPYDINIDYDSLSKLAAIHITYKRIDSDSVSLSSVMEDSQELISKHNVKSSGMGYEDVVTPSGMYATLVKIDGEVPNPYQFYVHDSSTHYLRGALYFKTATKNDSLAPLIEYTKDDLLHILKTLRWKE